MAVTLVCQHCGTTFERERKRRFCSGTCALNNRHGSLEHRFWSKVDKRCPDECWPWLATQRGGYGTIRVGDRKSSRLYHATNIALKLTGIEVPDGMFVLHSCDNKICVNPAHLRVGTREENTADAVNRNRYQKHEQRPLAKLTMEKAVAIRNAQATLKELSLKYGVCVAVISRIRRGLTWKE